MQYRELSDCSPCLILCFASLFDEKYYVDTGDHMCTDGTDSQSHLKMKLHVSGVKERSPPSPTKKENHSLFNIIGELSEKKLKYNRKEWKLVFFKEVSFAVLFL